MTIMEFFEQIKGEVLADIISISPYRKGLLSKSFYLVEYDDGFAVRTDKEYMKYVESLEYNGRSGSPKWYNYNYQWLMKYALVIAEKIAERLGGTVHVS